MQTRSLFYRSGALLAFVRITSQLSRLGRNVIIARILSPADYGLAATFWITISFLEMISEIGLQQRLIQAKNGDDDHVGAVAQTLFLVRGAMNAGILLLLAGPITVIFDAPQAVWAFRLLALIPLLGGFAHRDVFRMQRQLRFGPSAITFLVPDILCTIAAVPIVLVVRDYSAFLYVSLLNSVLTVLASHIVAERPFQLAWDRAVVRQFTGFGWPLMINSVLMYAVMQGDRIILAHSYTKEELGVYSVAIGLVMSASGMLLGVFGPLQLPLLASAQDDRPRFERHLHLQAIFMSAAAMVLGILFVTVGPALVMLVYGPKYELASLVVGWVGLTKAIHIMRSIPSTAAMALGDTRNSMYVNLVRQIGIGLALVFAWLGWGLVWIAISQLLGEVMAYLAAVPMLRSRHRLPLGICWKPAALAGGGISAALLVNRLGGPMQNWIGATGAFALVGGAFVIAYCVAFQEFAGELNSIRTIFSRRLQRAAAWVG